MTLGTQLAKSAVPELLFPAVPELIRLTEKTSCTSGLGSFAFVMGHVRN